MMLARPISLLLRDPDPDPPATPPPAPPADWKAALPPELASDPTIATIPDIPTLAKNVIEQRKFIGLKRVEAPGKDWDDAKWSAWHELSGRPKSKDEYVPPKVELPEGMTLDENRIKAAAEQAHKLGLNQKQFEGLTKWFLEGEVGSFKSATDQTLLDQQNSIKALQAEWKNDFAKNMDIAKSALQKYGGEDLFKFLDTHKLGNHPEMVKAFHKIGMELLEDTARGKGPGLPLNDATNAKLQIDELRMDEKFTAMLMNGQHPGHSTAVAKWTDLHRKAFGTEPVQ